jgi:hypothetical protein
VGHLANTCDLAAATAAGCRSGNAYPLVNVCNRTVDPQGPHCALGLVTTELKPS